MCHQEKMQQWMREMLLAVFAILSVMSISACTATPPEPSNPNTRTGGKLTPPIRNSTVSSNVGRFHALVIGNQNYIYLDKLKAPHHDAEEVAQVLEQKYGFKVERLFDANREQMMRALSKLRETMSSSPGEDSLLIYYAGHGSFDDATKRGYWQPTDAEKDNNVNWIRADEVTDVIIADEQIRHFLVVADSCYADWTVTGMRDAGTRLPESFASEWQRKSRHALTSGAKETVPDVGPNGHSVFANALLAVLQSNYAAQRILDGHKLFDQIAVQVDGYQNEHPDYPRHTPVYDYIPNTGHEHGDFLFFPVDQAGTGKIKKDLLATVSVPVSTGMSKTLSRADMPQPAPHIKNIKIVYNSSTEKLAQRISQALQRNNFPTTLEEFDKWDSYVLKNGLTHEQLSFGQYTLFFPALLQASVDDVNLIINPLLTGGQLENKRLDDERIVRDASIDTDELLIIIDKNSSQSWPISPFSWFAN